MNVRDNTYELYAVLSGGTRTELTGAIIGLEWGEQEGELAQRATIKLAQTNTSLGLLSEILPLCTRLQIKGNGKNVLDGLVWEWEYTSSNTRCFEIVAYDNMIYMQKSKSNSYFKDNTSTQTIISSICSEQGIPLKYNWGNHKHKKTVYRGQTIANQIISTLEDAKYKIDKKYVIKFVDGSLCIEEPGQNKTVYLFEGVNTIGTQHKQTLDGLVTKVLITGKESSSGKTPIKATVNGKTEFGTIQEIVSASSQTVSEAKAEAQILLKERGWPENTIRLEAPDVPTMRKGDKIKVVAGSLNGYYYVKGITHNATSMTMNLNLGVFRNG